MAESRRERMTRQMIQDAYFRLILDGRKQKLSVTEICKKADVNRTSFYAHYEDVVMLRRDIENHVLSQIPVLSEPDAITSDRQFVELLERFFAYIQENQRMFRVLILQPDSLAFTRRLVEAVLDKYRAAAGPGRAGPGDALLARYEYLFIVSGVIGLLGDWIEAGFPIGAKEFADVVLKMALAAASCEKEIPR